MTIWESVDRIRSRLVFSSKYQPINMSLTTKSVKRNVSYFYLGIKMSLSDPLLDNA